MHIKLLKAMLDMRGIGYTEENGQLKLAVLCGGHRLETVFISDKESFLRMFVRYPWSILQERRSKVLERLDELNGTLRAGCFLTLDGYVVFRYGSYIFDEYTAGESVSDLFLTGIAAADSHWNDIYAVCAANEMGL
ncbi:MAG: hypothetical protein ACI4KM_11170 [Oscillospiraceae bacterium]